MTVVADPAAGLGKMKGKKICAPSGLPAGTKPNLPEPKVMETQSIAPPSREAITRKPGAPRPGATTTTSSAASSRPTPGRVAAPSPAGGGARPTPPKATPTPPPSIPSPASRGGAGPAAPRGRGGMFQQHTHSLTHSLSLSGHCTV
jgi:hypothetical protein